MGKDAPVPEETSSLTEDAGVQADLPAPPAAPSEPTVAPSPIVDGKEHAVDPRSVAHARVVGLAAIIPVFIAPFIAITLGWALGGIPGAIYLALLAAWAVLFVTAAIWAYRWPVLHHRHLRYRVDEEGVRIRRGVLWRKVISIPTSRVQHTDVSQGPLQRRYELATLTVYTAGTQGASIELSGLEQTVARRLRDHLLPEHVDNGGA